MRATWPAKLTVVYFIILVTSGENFRNKLIFYGEQER
jgi:hypothetical protein